jgi:hypothetical protein
VRAKNHLKEFGPEEWGEELGKGHRGKFRKNPLFSSRNFLL